MNDSIANTLPCAPRPRSDDVLSGLVATNRLTTRIVGKRYAGHALRWIPTSGPNRGAGAGRGTAFDRSHVATVSSRPGIGRPMCVKLHTSCDHKVTVPSPPVRASSVIRIAGP